MFRISSPVSVWYLDLLVGKFDNLVFGKKTASCDANNEDNQGNKETFKSGQSQTNALNSLDFLALFILVRTSNANNLAHGSTTSALAINTHTHTHTQVVGGTQHPLHFWM